MAVPLDTQEQLARQHRFRFHFLLDADHAFKLRIAAAERKLNPNLLASYLMAAVLNDNLIDAVLDDAKDQSAAGAATARRGA